MAEFERNMADGNKSIEAIDAALESEKQALPEARAKEIVDKVAHSERGMQIFMKVLGTEDYSPEFTTKVANTLKRLADEHTATIDRLREQRIAEQASMQTDLDRLKTQYLSDKSLREREGNEALQKIECHLREALTRQDAVQAHVKALMAGNKVPYVVREEDITEDFRSAVLAQTMADVGEVQCLQPDDEETSIEDGEETSKESDDE
jgi:hypothetical protein